MACSMRLRRISRWRRRRARGSTPSVSSTRARPVSRPPSSPGRCDAVSAPAVRRLPQGGGRAPAYSAVRTRRGLVVVLFALAAAGWWWTADQMQGMDNGPWTHLGTLGWFLTVWIVMMAAMMFPSVAPTVALYSSITKTRSPLSPVMFTTGYLVTWAAAGVLAFSGAWVVDSMWGDVLAWDQ